MRSDQFGLPLPPTCIVEEFEPGRHVWKVPRGKSMCFILAIGSGGGGGGGFTNTTGTVRGGGGGGGSGAMTRLMIPVMFLPNALYLKVAYGGRGGTAGGGGGTNGEISYVLTDPAGAGTIAFTVLQSGGVAAGGGTGGSGAGSAAGGAAGTLIAAGSCPFANFGTFISIAGKVGAAGGAVGGAAGSANALLTANPLNGGAGGGTTPAANTNFAGGDQTGAGGFNTITGGVAGGNPGNGAGGPWQLNPFVSYGGAGGGTGGAAGQVGGNGGDAGIGSGGGGGGGGVTGGAGGRGGDGRVWIVCW